MTKLQTIEDVNRALDMEYAIRAAGLRTMKRAEDRLSCGRVADLLEIRRDLFKALLERLHEVAVPGALHEIGMAVSRAIDADDDSVKHWRNLAGQR